MRLLYIILLHNIHFRVQQSKWACRPLFKYNQGYQLKMNKGLAKGVYIISAMQGSIRSSKKIIVQQRENQVGENRPHGLTGSSERQGSLPLP
jgi:hypothetical protein